MASARPTPNIAGFAEAQAAKLEQLGSDVTFLTAPVRTWPGGTVVNPDTGDPYDPTLEPVSVDRDQFTMRCAVFFRAMTRGGSSGGETSGSAAGWEERTRVFVIAPYARRAELERAVEFIFHEDHWKIEAIKVDEIVGGYRRMVLYGALL